MLLLIPASVAVHRYELAALLLGLLFLAGAALLLLAGFWLRFRWVNLVAIGLGGLSALLFRVLSHAGKLHTPALLLCFVAVVVAAIATLRAFSSGAGSVMDRDTGKIVRRIRKRKRRPPVQPDSGDR